VAGHSKWAQIKRKKEATDQRRGRLFAKLLRTIEVAAREGGGNVEGNMTLASAVEKAREFSVPIENIERAIKRGTGELEGAKYDEVTYEGYAPGGVAVMVACLTDNRNRTAQEVRRAFTRNGGTLADPGATAWMFARKGVILVERATFPDEERLLEVALEAGADDLRASDGSWEITASPQAFTAVREALEAAGVPIYSAELTMVPNATVRVEGEQARRVLQVIDALEELDDVQAVYANFDVPEEVLAEVG
jgi:YebC/PmpR family DNA-binding regulatory protein